MKLHKWVYLLKFCFLNADNILEPQRMASPNVVRYLLYDFLVTLKAATHECVIKTGQP